ncbi:MAG: endo-1,4-beta-xylanase [Chloroflexota bacterium]|nr:endo-1,4-beta-xylanase [Chloroflexota bacterium]
MNVKKSLTRFIIALAGVGMLAGVVSAQEVPSSLRDMAEASGITVGAATDVWDFEAHPRFEETLVTYFNSVTPENHGKMCFIQPSEGEFNFVELDQLVDLAEANGMAVHGHTLVWHSCFPAWLQGRDLSRDEAIAMLETHIQTVVERYKGRIAIWDVVNEPFEDDGRLRDTPWLTWIGEDYIALAFQFARAADPDALLYLNEYDAEVINAKSNALYELVRDSRRAGVPIDGVGMQMHVAVGEVVEGGIIDPASFENNIRRLGQIGVEVAVTEMDVAHMGAADEETMRLLAGHYYTIFETCVRWKEFCKGFTTWGLFDGETWLRSPEFYNNPNVSPLLFNENMEPKLAYTALLDVLARDQDLTPVLTDEMVAALSISSAREVVVAPVQRSDPDQLAPDSAHGELYYAAFPVAITVDGDPSDWANVPRDTVFTGNLIPAGNTTEMVFAAAADADNLYFLAEVTDDTIISGVHPTSEWYKEDSVEFYINASGDLATRAYIDGIAQIALLAVNIGNTGDPIIAGGGSQGIAVAAVVVETETGYRVEAAVPLVTAKWSITPTHEGFIGFQAHLNGSSGSDRDTKLIWSAYDTQDQSWADPSVFGRLMFWDSTQ